MRGRSSELTSHCSHRHVRAAEEHFRGIDHAPPARTEANESFTQRRRSASHVRVWIESWKYDMS